MQILKRLNNPLIKTVLENNGLWSIVFNALSKGIYFILILLVGRLLSADSKTDIFFFTNEFIKIIFGYSLFINSDVLIPRLIALRTKNEAEIGRFLGFFYTTYISFSIVITLTAIVFPKYCLLFLSKFPESSISSNYLIFCFLFPNVILTILNGLQSAILTAYNYFAIPNVITFFSNCLSLLLYLLFYKSLGIFAVILGIIAASIINSIVLAYYIRKKCKIKAIPTLKIDSYFFKSFNFLFLVFVTFSIYNFGLIYLLSAAEESTTTAHNYAAVIAFIPYQFLGIQLTTIFGNKFSELYNLQKYEELKAYIKRALLLLVIIILPICIFNMFFFVDIVKLIIGRKFEQDWWYFYKTSMFLKYFALQAFFSSVYLLVVRIYTATLRIKVAAIMQGSSGIGLLIADYIGFRFFDIKGFCIASLVVYFLMFITALMLTLNFFKILNKQLEYKKTSVFYTLVV
jgi:peptidoglycan biosynthesis protein MviN/MurJ (putative lipid II flippase)